MYYNKIIKQKRTIIFSVTPKMMEIWQNLLVQCPNCYEYTPATEWGRVLYRRDSELPLVVACPVCNCEIEYHSETGCDENNADAFLADVLQAFANQESWVKMAETPEELRRPQREGSVPTEVAQIMCSGGHWIGLGELVYEFYTPANLNPQWATVKIRCPVCNRQIGGYQPMLQLWGEEISRWMNNPSEQFAVQEAKEFMIKYVETLLDLGKRCVRFLPPGAESDFRE